MMEKVFVKPAKEGLLVRKESDPKQFISPQGEYVSYTTRVRRLVKKWGDLVIVDSAQEIPVKEEIVYTEEINEEIVPSETKPLKKKKKSNN